MRQIKEIIIHCSATPKKMDIGVKEIDVWHRKRGWAGCGYHFVIRRNGKLETGRPIKTSGAHCKGHNKNSIGICLVGGVDTKNKPENNFTIKQFKSLQNIIESIEDIHGDIGIHGHNEFSKKDCPCFNVKDWVESLIVKEPVKVIKKPWWRFW